MHRSGLVSCRNCSGQCDLNERLKDVLLKVGKELAVMGRRTSNRTRSLRMAKHFLGIGMKNQQRLEVAAILSLL